MWPACTRGPFLPRRYQPKSVFPFDLQFCSNQRDVTFIDSNACRWWKQRQFHGQNKLINKQINYWMNKRNYVINFGNFCQSATYNTALFRWWEGLKKRDGEWGRGSWRWTISRILDLRNCGPPFQWSTKMTPALTGWCTEIRWLYLISNVFAYSRSSPGKAWEDGINCVNFWIIERHNIEIAKHNRIACPKLKKEREAFN